MACRREERCFDDVDDERGMGSVTAFISLFQGSMIMIPRSRGSRLYSGLRTQPSPRCTIREMMKPKKRWDSIISRSQGHGPTMEGGRNVLERLVPRTDPHV